LPKTQQTTIKEIAEEAGVSKQTVSRVLNNRPDVSLKTRKKIKAIIENSGYRPSELALSLVRGRTSTIGVISSGIQHYGSTQMLAGIEEQANSEGYSLSLSLLHEPEDHQVEMGLRKLEAQRVAGIIWAGIAKVGDRHLRNMAELRRLQLPTVVRGRPHLEFTTVNTDNYAGATMATQHLVSQRYQVIGIITGAPEDWSTNQCLKGWQDALQSSNMPSDQTLTVEGDWTALSGAIGLEKLLEQRPDVDAVFASNDQMALGALHAAQLLGRRVPRDLGVIGYNDVPDARFFTPALSTIRTGLVEMGRTLVLELDSEIQAERNNEVREVRSIVIPPELVVRTSSNVNRAREPLSS
jgi:LacI family transcriptional regulator